VRRLDLVELQCGGDRVKDVVRDTRDVPALDLDVVLGAHAREKGDLLAAKASDATAPT
jgi:hypothetical protein